MTWSRSRTSVIRSPERESVSDTGISRLSDPLRCVIVERRRAFGPDGSMEGGVRLDGDRVGVGRWIGTMRRRVWRRRLPSGLSPKMINIAAAVVAPTAKLRVGAVSAVSRSRCRSCVAISPARADRSVCFPEAMGVSSGPGRSPAQRVTRARRSDPSTGGTLMMACAPSLDRDLSCRSRPRRRRFWAWPWCPASTARAAASAMV